MINETTQDEGLQRFSVYGFHFNIVGAEPTLDGCIHVKLKHRHDESGDGGLWDFQCYAGNLFKQIPELAEIVMSNSIQCNWDSKRDGLSRMFANTCLASDGTRLSGSILHFRGNKLKQDAVVIALQSWNSALANASRPFLNITDRTFSGIVKFAKDYKKENKQ